MTIDKFTGKYRFLSNSYMTPICYDGVVYRTVEHAFLASKTSDTKLRNIFRQCRTPEEAKKYDDLIEIREDWEDVKEQIMYELVKQKFQNKELRKKLLNTGDSVLVNTIGKDSYWGIYNGRGENRLGQILMQLRAEIRGES